MTLNPFAPTFRPQQRTKPYSLSRKHPLVEMDSSGPSDSPTKAANALASDSHLQPIEEQIHSLSAQLNQLQTFSEASIQQTTPLLQKFPLAHLKQVQYLHSVQLTVAKLHQDLESERLERQTLQLLVFQLQKDLMFTQNILVNPKNETPPRQFSIDPPSAGAVTNPAVPETHELPRASASQIILMGDSKTPKSSALPSTILRQVSSSPQTTRSALSPDLLSKLNTLEKQTKDDLSRQKSLISSMQSNYSVLYDKIRQLEAGSNNTILWRISSVRFIFDSAKSAHRQSKPLNDKTTGYWSPVFRTHPYGYNFIIRFHPYGIDATAGQFATIIFAFFPGDYDGLLRWPFPKAIHLSLRDQLDPLNAWTQTIQPTQEPPFKRPTSSLKNDAFAVAFYKYIPHSKLFSETDGYVVNDTCYIEVSFTDPNVQKSSAQNLPFPPFP